MPFAALQSPSIALTQLKAVTEERFQDRVSVEVYYINHDYAKFVGLNVYNLIAVSLDTVTTGLGDWIFRQSAFPNLQDNADQYMRRYYPYQDGRTRDIKQMVAKTRRGLDGFLDQVIQKYKLDRANLVGFTSMFAQNVSCFALARRIKKCNPDVVTVMGGANCEFPMGQEIVKNVPQIDFVFSGPALKSFPQFIQYQIEGEGNNIHSIPGVFSKRNCSLTPLGCGGAIGEELQIDVDIKLDYEPFLQILEHSFPGDAVSPRLLFETSRGCWWGEKSHCTFCGLNGGSMRYRSMSPEKAITQFEELFKYSGRCKLLESVDNILPKNYIKDVLPKIKTPPGVKIFYEVKADLSAEDMEAMAKAGVCKIQPGIESLATSTLKLMHKGTNVFINLTLLKNCITYGIDPAWNLLIGFPGEGQDVYKKYLVDIPLLIHLPPPSGIFPVRFDRYSPYFMQAERYKLDLRPLDYYRMIYPFEERQLANLAYYFSDANLSAPYFTDMAQWIDKLKEQVRMWRARWFNANNRNKPMLYFKGDNNGQIIVDTRSDTLVEHRISETSHQILEYLNKPRRIVDVAEKMSHVAGFNAESEVGLLRERGLTFQEGERYMNIVLPMKSNKPIT
jgi:ribosomal peptide maturation radical SAM protein 1